MCVGGRGGGGLQAAPLSVATFRAMRVAYLPRGSLNFLFSNAKCPLLYNTLIMFFENTVKLYLWPGVKPEISTLVFVRLTLLGVNFNSHSSPQPTSYFKDLGNPPCSKGGSQLRVNVPRESLFSTLILRTFVGKPAKQRNTMGSSLYFLIIFLNYIPYIIFHFVSVQFCRSEQSTLTYSPVIS